jgi:hypothetical protein
MTGPMQFMQCNDCEEWCHLVCSDEVAVPKGDWICYFCTSDDEAPPKKKPKPKPREKAKKKAKKKPKKKAPERITIKMRILGVTWAKNSATVLIHVDPGITITGLEERVQQELNDIDYADDQEMFECIALHDIEQR